MTTPPTPTKRDWTPDAAFDGGDLDCGNGLLLLIRRHIDPLPRGGLLEIRSTESSVAEDLPAWCRLTGNELVSSAALERGRIYLVCKGSLAERTAAKEELASGGPTLASPATPRTIAAPRASSADVPLAIAAAPPIPPRAVLGIGSWPRPRWLLRALHERLEGRLAEEEFEAAADDAVRLAVAAQSRAGVDVVTDGEQRRDSYASFVGARLENCQLIPITDLLPYVDHPEQFAQELAALDVPAQEVRHPAVFGPIRRRRDLAVHEYRFLRTLSDRPCKVALPGPYLLTRTMWLDCVVDKAYASREALAQDIVQVLREELLELLAAGVSLVQFDEPVLTEVVYGAPHAQRSFMCGALSERRDSADELQCAQRLLRELLDGIPRERTALHVCRGNWSRDERVALAGDYRPLAPLLSDVPVGTYFLELATPRAGELEVLADLPADRRIGIGVVNQKLDEVETLDLVRSRCAAAIRLLGADRVLFNPDCGFATFADNPLASAEIAEAKLKVIAEAVRSLE